MTTDKLSVADLLRVIADAVWPRREGSLYGPEVILASIACRLRDEAARREVVEDTPKCPQCSTAGSCTGQCKSAAALGSTDVAGAYQRILDDFRKGELPKFPPTPPADERAELDSFTEWLCREMPPNTVIGDPKWWAPRIARALMRSDGARIAELEASEAHANKAWMAMKNACDIKNARIAELERERDALDIQAQEWKAFALDYKARAEAAEAREKGLRDFVESFSAICDEESFYKDCCFNFHAPHSISVRFVCGSDKAFIVAEFEKRRKAALAQKESDHG